MLALYDHGTCGSMFFAEIDTEECSCYEGKCPNPNCNRHVVLQPKTCFRSIDKARRDYIKKTKSGDATVFWHA
ncbi:MAG TPA: hypothetical protein PLB81_06545 [Deltaproteobacteria bacterium]|nr:hypothetical protein [Deltaproteobacteria bacterium]